MLIVLLLHLKRKKNEPETAAVHYQTLQVVDFIVFKLKDQLTRKDKLYVAQLSVISKNSTGSSRLVEVKFLK